MKYERHKVHKMSLKFHRGDFGMQRAAVMSFNSITTHLKAPN